MAVLVYTMAILKGARDDQSQAFVPATPGNSASPPLVVEDVAQDRAGGACPRIRGDGGGNQRVFLDGLFSLVALAIRAGRPEQRRLSFGSRLFSFKNKTAPIESGRFFDYYF